MSKALAKLFEVEAESLPKEILFAVKIGANRKANFDEMIELCRSAAYFKSEGYRYAVVFDRSPPDIRRGAAFLAQTRDWKAGLTLITDGRVVTNRNPLWNTVMCADQALEVENKASHCHCEVRRATKPASGTSFTLAMPDLSLSDEENLARVFGQAPPEDAWLVPCKRSAPKFLIHRAVNETPKQSLKAAAINTHAIVCPYFELDQLKIVEAPPTSKRYWK